MINNSHSIKDPTHLEQLLALSVSFFWGLLDKTKIQYTNITKFT